MKAFLFDFDGVLVPNTSPMHAVALNASLQFHGYPIMDQALRDSTLPSKVKLQKMGIRADMIPTICEKKNSYLNHILRIEPDLRLAQTLIWVKQRMGLKMAICTNTNWAFVERCLKQACIPHGLFEVLITNELGYKPKPYPDIYVAAACQFTDNMRECAVFEDSSEGIQAGKKAGCEVYKVAGPHELTEQFFGDVFTGRAKCE